MSKVMQYSFNSGEWAPALNARVDISKYHSGAALLRNFFVDYRGGATTSPGTKYVLQAFKSSTAVRLIPFQASFAVSYVLEFGDGYIRFFNNGAPVLEPPVGITAITNANPGSVTIASAIAALNDWFLITGVGGMTQVNGNYFIAGGSGANFSLKDLFGVGLNTTAFGVYTSGGTVQRVYTIVSPYTAAELAQVKFAQNVNQMILCHPNHPPYILTLISANNWTLVPIAFGATIASPVAAVASTLAAGGVIYGYKVTAVDSNGQESAPSAPAVTGLLTDIRTTPGTNVVSWTTISGAVSYNVYKAEPSYSGGIAAGAAYGFIGNCTGLSFADSNIAQDFAQGIPVVQNPFSGAGVATITLTNPGAYGAGVPIPTVTISGGGGSGATASATLTAASVSIDTAGFGYGVGDVIYMPAGIVVQVDSIGGFGSVTGIHLISSGSINTGFTPPGSFGQNSTSGSGTGFRINATWKVGSLTLTNSGSGYVGAPAVTFSGGGATATTTLGASSAGNPTVPGFYDQRLVLAGPAGNPQQFNMSKPGAPFNYNITFPADPADAIQGSLVSGQLNTIQSLITQPQGLITLSDKQAWLINGGSPGAPVSAIQIVANSQAYNGSSGLPPIVANDNILYVQSKQSIVRDLVFNFYTNVYTGTDISVLSSHLFYGFTILEWAWAEEPFKLVWAVRNDGQMLTLTFLKEQELVAWAHRDTQGSFKSVASVTELVAVGNVDAVYTTVQRTINGNVVQYIERMAELYYPTGLTNAWRVDAGLQYSGPAVLNFTGATHLAGMVVTGLATDDTGAVTVLNFTMPINQTGAFSLAAPPAPATGYTRVTIGLGFTPQLQTLQLDLGEPTIQGEMKKISAVTARVNQTLGLYIGSTFGTLVPMKDLVRGNVGSATNALVTDLVTGDAMTILDPQFTVPGQYCFQMNDPFPASILGIIPEVSVVRNKK